MTMIDYKCSGVFYSLYASPIGDLTLTSDGAALTGLYMCQHRGQPGSGPEASWQRDDSAFQAVREQLASYFEGKLRDFDLPLRMDGTPFQQRVWQGLRAIPFGETISYAELARRIGHPGASRAVGSANGRNPISIVVPCHRVIAADGTLGGYGGGLDRKDWLLQHETAARVDWRETQPSKQRRATSVMVD
jgi:methylated-DNA-[protein]-cysteine S-methyltransferase